LAPFFDKRVGFTMEIPWMAEKCVLEEWCMVQHLRGLPLKNGYMAQARALHCIRRQAARGMKSAEIGS